MKDFDKLFEDLFGEDEELDEIEAQLDELDLEESDEASAEGDPATVGESPTLESFLHEDEDEDEGGGDGDEFIEDTEVGGAFNSSCPYCGEVVSIFLDPAGGSAQDYVEDCSVCCQPMTVRVRFVAEGQADVLIDTAD